ncbi:MAG: MBL fold metallo-hydrolase [Candidatus Hodarchaeales archaeon]|jgi:7,8-dihydropterin-6-yl-methyl-4-(beta-D-ribofuranosyl)aminobenzene 5'-phosphate synthase
MKIQKLTIQILVENVSGPGGTLGESGFSAFTEVLFNDQKKLKILFDTGPSPVAFLNNVKKLKVDLTTIDAIVLSHGHWDHVGGLKEAIALTKKRIPVICHPQALSPKYFHDKGEIIDVGIQEFFESPDDIKKQANLISTTSSHRFNGSVMTTGEVPRRNDFEKLSGDLLKDTTITDNEEVPDKLIDDLSLVFHLTDDSVVVLTGCCHAGIVNTVSSAIELTGSSKIVGIVGGLHLHDASDNRLSQTVRELKKYPIKKIASCHCSGFRGKYAIFTAFGKKFHEVTVATTTQFEATL